MKHQNAGSLEQRIAGGMKMYHQAAALGHEVFRLIATANDAEVARIKALFLAELDRGRFTDVMAHQARYAIRLARSEGDLEYEEMHKLFSLCDEVAALRALGRSMEAALETDLSNALRERFARERRKARLVAQDRFEPGQSGWWYLENLSEP